MSRDVTGWKPLGFPDRNVLDGQWCRLEPLSAQIHGGDLWRQMQGHDSLWDYMAPPAPQSEAEYRALLHSMQTRTDIVPLAIVDKSDGEAKGHLWIMEIRPDHGVFEVGTIVFSPALQRTRMATEAIYLVGEYGFSLGYRRYEWKCNNLNEPSKRAAKRFGFTFEGLFRQHMVVKGKNRDTAWYSIIDDEWTQRKAAFESWLQPENFDKNGKQKSKLTAI